jgi:hypothetical protein
MALGKGIVSPKAQAALHVLRIYDEFDGVRSKAPGSGGREDVASCPGPFAMAEPGRFLWLFMGMDEKRTLVSTERAL